MWVRRKWERAGVPGTDSREGIPTDPDIATLTNSWYSGPRRLFRLGGGTLQFEGAGNATSLDISPSIIIFFLQASINLWAVFYARFNSEPATIARRCATSRLTVNYCLAGSAFHPTISSHSLLICLSVCRHLNIIKTTSSINTHPLKHKKYI